MQIQVVLFNLLIGFQQDLQDIFVFGVACNIHCTGSYKQLRLVITVGERLQLWTSKQVAQYLHCIHIAKLHCQDQGSVATVVDVVFIHIKHSIVSAVD